jgi:hypothetical protein
MILTLNKLGDRLLERLLPTTTAAAATFCYTQFCCEYKYRRDCCNDENGTVCGPWYYA